MKSLLSQNFYQTMSDLLQTLISHPEQVFSGCTVLLDSKETEIESKDLEASHSAGKNTERVLVPCQKWKCPYNYFHWRGYFQGPQVSLVTTDEFLVRVTKITSRIGVSFFNQFKLNKLWPHYQKHVNQIIFNHTTLSSLFL